MAEVVAPGTDEPDRGPSPQPAQKADRGGFFTIYKKGQGYWTRIGSAAAAALIILFATHFLWVQLPPMFTPDNVTGETYRAASVRARNITLGVCGAWLIGSSLLVWHLLNRPTNADFLIATDSEMKKVNWTTRRELIGSTKVVIIFMFLIAAILFLLDMYFTRLFYLIGVLSVDAPLWDYASNFGARIGLPRGLMRAALDLILGVLIFGSAAWAVYGTSKRR